MNLIHDLPENKGVENGIKRALQMTEIRWTPLAAMAGSLSFTVKDENGEFLRQYAPYYFSSFQPNFGMVYSSVLKNQKFLGYNVSLETFMTALSDPRSVLYKKNLHGTGRNNVGCWYGIVCSCFASYVHDLPVRTICRDWPFVENVTRLDQPEVEDLKLLDIVLHVKKHIAVITDIIRDENGKVQFIEVSEATLPKCKRTRFTPEEFRGYWYKREFNIYRKSDTEKITYTPSPFVRIEADPDRGITADPVLPAYEYNKDIMPDQGNASNYMAGDEIFVDALTEGWGSVKVEKTCGDGSSDIYAFADGTAVITAGEPGYYTARAVKADGTESAPVCWAVNRIGLTSDKKTYSPGEKAVFTFEDLTGADVYMFNINRVKTSGEVIRGFFDEKTKKAASFETALPQETGDFFAYVSAKNKYGIFVSEYCFFTVE